MTGNVDLTISPIFWAAFAMMVVLPFLLWLTGKIPGLAPMYGRRFAWAGLLGSLLWTIAITISSGNLLEKSAATLVVFSITIVVLQAWGLLTRGFTLAVVLALWRIGSPARPDAVAAAYRAGEGLEALMTIRVGGMLQAQLVRKTGDVLELTKPMGHFVVYAYVCLVKLLGLKRTG